MQSTRPQPNPSPLEKKLTKPVLDLEAVWNIYMYCEGFLKAVRARSFLSLQLF